MDLNNHIVSTGSASPFHSNGYAVAANDRHIGAASSESFSHRLQTEQNRRVVGNYARSNLAQSYISSARPAANFQMPIRGTQVSSRPLINQPRGFVEPRSRGYNPYS